MSINCRKCEYGDYIGFSKQDLKDRQKSLYNEYKNNYKRNEELINEIEHIADILDEILEEEKNE